MKKILNFNLVISIFLIGSFSWAAVSSSSGRVSQLTRTNPLSLDFSGALVTVGGTYGGAFLAGVGLPVSRTSPVRLGLHSGVMFGAGAGLPILASLVYRFYEGQSNSIHPYIGGAVGPVIGLSGGSVTINGFTVNTGNSAMGDGVKLAILVRPGINFPVTDTLDVNVETPMGGLTGVFYIAPTVGVQLKL